MQAQQLVAEFGRSRFDGYQRVEQGQSTLLEGSRVPLDKLWGNFASVAWLISLLGG